MEVQYTIITKNDNNSCDNKLNMNILKDSLPVFRYKLKPETIEVLNEFAKIHRFDDRHDFKEAWEEWLDYNDEIVDEEKQRLKRLGYEGDVEDKMYKSVRYYYRKKPLTKQEPIQRRRYTSISKELLKAMDKHINEHYKNNEFKPALGYDLFCSEYLELIKEEIQNMGNINELDAKNISSKFKKTYKNRYFRVSRNMTIVSSSDEERDNNE